MKIKELTLLTNDLVETEIFYTNILQFAISSKSNNSISFLVGKSILTFTLNIKPTQPIYHFAFLVPLDLMEDVRIKLSRKIDLIKPENNSEMVFFSKWKAKSFYFLDNNNNILECIAREDLAYYLDEGFTFSHIININEVGVASDSPLDLSEKLMIETGVSYFSKGPIRADFVALGTEEGLIVITDCYRNWFPTQNLAEKHCVKVKIEINSYVHDVTFN